jgi:hypothetical protein
MVNSGSSTIQIQRQFTSLNNINIKFINYEQEKQKRKDV